jgi:hypothetical protein
LYGTSCRFLSFVVDYPQHGGVAWKQYVSGVGGVADMKTWKVNLGIAGFLLGMAFSETLHHAGFTLTVWEHLLGKERKESNIAVKGKHTVKKKVAH